MKAVNLIPQDARGGRGDVRDLRSPGFAVLGVLAMALILLTLYVLASNSISDKQSQLANVQQQVAETQAASAKLTGYTKFAALAQARVVTVKSIAASRFDWQEALSDLARVVPANTSLSTVTATVSPGDGTSGGGGSGGGLRSDISAPAFELQGCTATQDDVARLMSQLRLIRGVTRVTLADAVKPTSTATATPTPGSSPATPTTGTSGGVCTPNAPTFDLVVFFTPPPVASAAPTGATGATGATGTTGAIGTATTASTTTTPPATGSAG